jgi:multidrug efflux pump subunit AcrA (membrane-fusion protein)
MKKIFSKSFWLNIKKYTSANKPLTIIIVIIVISLFSYYFLNGSKTTSTQYVLGKVTRGDLIVSVSGSGQVATLSEVDLKPQTTGQTQTLGQIVSVKVQNGDIVSAGQIIAILDGKTTLQSLNQAKANLESAQANYDKLINGPTASDLQSLTSSLQNSQLSVRNYKQNILTKLQNAYTSASNAIYINTDPLFNNPMTSGAHLSVSNVSFTNQQLQANADSGRVSIGEILQSWKQEINSVSTSSDLVISINSALSKLNVMRLYFDDMTSLFASYAVSSGSGGQSSIDSDKGIYSSARSSIDSSISDLISTLQGYQSAINSLAQTQQSYDFKIAPPAESDVIVSKSQLDNAKAAYTTAEQNYSSRIITAPFDGQVGGLTAQVGQQISSSDSLGKLITPSKVVNVTLNEVDAAKVKKGDIAIITFDALPNVSLAGHISYVDPLGTVSQGVVSYSIQIVMDEQNNQIKTGMTAIVNITTDLHSAVLMIPSSAITIKGTKKFVTVPDSSMVSNNILISTSTFSNATTSTRKFRNASSTPSLNVNSIPSTTHQVEITAGISNNISTEVLSGLNEGEEIVVKIVIGSDSLKTAASSATTRTTRGMGGFEGGAVGAAVMK